MADLPVRPNAIPLTEQQLADWQGNITKARELRQKAQRWAEANLKAYAPSMDDDPDDYGTHVNTNRDFTLVERKKADLFYQSPEISPKPSPLFEGGAEQLLDTHASILNEKLGLDGVNAKVLVHQALFDVLCPTGTGWTIMGYESATVATPVPHPQTGEPLMHPVTGDPVTVPVPVYEDCFWRWFSPKQALVPGEFRSTLWDDAPWLGMEFEMPVRAAKRKGWVPPEYVGAPSSSELHFEHGRMSSGDNVARGSMIYYKSALYRDDVVHPQHMTLLVLMDGVELPAEHRDSPYQDLDQAGGLAPDSLIGFPIHPLTIRTLTDSSSVPSDCTISRPLVNELNKFRQQTLQHRDANGVRYGYNAGKMPAEIVSKAVRDSVGGFLGFPDDVWQESGPEGPFKPLAQGSYPRENFEFQNLIDHDIATSHAMDSNQQGVLDQSGTTATEAQIQQANVNARLGLERGVVLDWYVRGVTKFSTLLQRYMTLEQAAKIVGPQKAQEWDGWRKQVPSSLAFTAMPDSALRSDTAADRKTATDLYSFFAQDPNVNRMELLKSVLRKHHLNPEKIVVEQPPEKQPDPVTFSVAIKSESLNPALPEYANLYQILTQSGVKGLVQPIAEAILNQPPPETPKETEHGGKVAPQENLSRHASDITGGMQGTGQPAELGAGGTIQ